jgi:hypothetical protein
MTMCEVAKLHEALSKPSLTQTALEHKDLDPMHILRTVDARSESKDVSEP